MTKQYLLKDPACFNSSLLFLLSLLLLSFLITPIFFPSYRVVNSWEREHPYFSSLWICPAFPLVMGTNLQWCGRLVWCTALPPSLVYSSPTFLPPRLRQQWSILYSPPRMQKGKEKGRKVQVRLFFLLNRYCVMDRVSSKFLGWNPNSQCDESSGAFRRWLDFEGGDLMSGISPL